VAVELTPSAGFAPREEAQRFSLFGLMGRVLGLKRAWCRLLLLALALEVTSIVAPFYMQWVVDQALVSGGPGLDHRARMASSFW